MSAEENRACSASVSISTSPAVVTPRRSCLLKNSLPPRFCLREHIRADLRSASQCYCAFIHDHLVLLQ